MYFTLAFSNNKCLLMYHEYIIHIQRILLFFMMTRIILFNVAFFSLIQVYKDLLAVTSTSEFVFIKLVFIEIAIKESFYDFLLNHLEFTKTTEFETTEEQAENVNDMLVDVMNNDNRNTRNNNIFNFLFKFRNSISCLQVTSNITQRIFTFCLKIAAIGTTR